MSRVLRVLPSARADVTASFNHLQHQGSPAAAWVDAIRADGKRFDPREGFKVK